jgi:ABC-type amino acid transport substrate-binding protein
VLFAVILIGPIVFTRFRRADIALSQLTPTDERRKHVDFTDAYLTSPPGVLLRAGVDAIDVHELQQLRWVVSSASTLTPIVTDRIRPEHDPLVVVDRAQALRVLRSGRGAARTGVRPAMQLRSSRGTRLPVERRPPRDGRSPRLGDER